MDITPGLTDDSQVFAQNTDAPPPTGDATYQPTVAPTVEPTPLKTAEPAPTYHVDPEKPMLCLTFDDGPKAASTNRILDVLEEYDSRATFFVVGDRIEKYHECIERAHALGCEIGNHTYDHKYRLTELNEDDLFEELDLTDELLLHYTGEIAPFVRPPWGTYDERVLSLVDRPLIRWSIDTQDWKTKDRDSIISEVIGKVKDGDIVLMHDIHDATADAIEYLVPALVEEGYQLVTVSEMFSAKGLELTGGFAYYYGAPKGIRDGSAP